MAEFDPQAEEWERHELRSFAANRCPYSGGPLFAHDDGLLRCPGVCDCFGIDPAEIAAALR